MSDAKRIAKNIALVVGGGTFRAVLMPLFTFLIARKLGTENFGKYSFALSLAYVLVILGEMGLPKMVVRELATHKEDVNKYIGDMTILRLITGLASMGVIIIIIEINSRTADSRLPLFLIGLSFLVFTGLRRFFDAIFQAFEVMKYQALVDMVDILLTFGVGTALLFNGYGLMGVAFAMMAGATISMALDFIILTRKLGKPKFTFDWAFWRKMALGALPFGIIGLITFLFGYTSTVVVSLVKDNHQAGLFSSAYRLIMAVTIIPATCMTVIFPFLTRIGSHSPSRYREVVRLLVKYLSCLSIPISGLIVIEATQLISSFYGRAYVEARPALWILAAIPLFSFIYIPLIDLLNAHYKQKLNVIAILMSAAINITLCFILSPLFGFVGAAISTLVAEGFLFIIMLFFSWKHMKIHPRHFNNWKPLLATVAAFCTCLPLRNMLPFFPVLITYFLLYAAVLLALRTFDVRDISLFKSLLPNKATY